MHHRYAFFRCSPQLARLGFLRRNGSYQHRSCKLGGSQLIRAANRGSLGQLLARQGSLQGGKPLVDKGRVPSERTIIPSAKS